MRFHIVFVKYKKDNVHTLASFPGSLPLANFEALDIEKQESLEDFISKLEVIT